MHKKTPLKARLQAKRSQIGLDWLNFFIADVQTGFGPFVAVYLATQHWTQSEIGYAAIGIGAAVSMAGSGYLVQHFGYTAGFLTLGAIAACGIVVLWLLLAETKPGEFAKYAAQQARA